MGSPIGQTSRSWPPTGQTSRSWPPTGQTSRSWPPVEMVVPASSSFHWWFHWLKPGSRTDACPDNLSPSSLGLVEGPGSLVAAGGQVLPHVGHDLAEEEGEVHGDEEEDDQVVQETHQPEHSLRDEVEGGEEVEEPHGGQHSHPELEGEVEALPGEEVVHQVAEQHRQVPDGLHQGPRLAGVPPVVGMDLLEQPAPRLYLLHLSSVPLLLGEVWEHYGDPLPAVGAGGGLQGVTAPPHLQDTVPTVDVAAVGLQREARLAQADRAVVPCGPGAAVGGGDRGALRAGGGHQAEHPVDGIVEEEAGQQGGRPEHQHLVTHPLHPLCLYHLLHNLTFLPLSTFTTPPLHLLTTSSPQLLTSPSHRTPLLASMVTSALLPITYQTSRPIPTHVSG